MPGTAHLTLPANTKRSVRRIIEDRCRKNGRIKSSVPTNEVLDESYSTSLPATTDSFDSFLELLQAKSSDSFAEANAILRNNGEESIENPSSSAFNNCNGRWTEYAYAAYVWNTLVDFNISNRQNAGEEPHDVYIYVKLPNRKAEDSDWVMLLKNNITQELQTYPVTQSTRIRAGHPNFNRRFELISSNPDAVILKFKSNEIDLYWNAVGATTIDIYTPINSLNLAVTNDLDSIFHGFSGSVLPSANLQCFLSVKRSTRPDRRYQWVHEGDHVKTILQWISNGHTLDPTLEYADLDGKFFAVSLSELSDADKSAMDTGLVGSIISPALMPVWAVDRLFECTLFSEIHDQVVTMIRFVS